MTEIGSAQSQSRTTAYRVSLCIPWWLSPIGLTGLVALPIIFATQLLPTSSFGVWSVPKYWNGTTAAIALVFVSFLLAGLFLTGGRPRTIRTDLSINEKTTSALLSASRWLLRLTVLGYLLWVASAIAQGATLDLLRNALLLQEGAIGQLKDRSVPLSGLSTLTQLGPLYVGVWVILYRMGRRVPRDVVPVLLLACVRAFLYGERLALIEVLVPLLAGLLCIRSDQPDKPPPAVFAALLLPLVWSVFAVFEYSRSWLYYRTFSNLSFVEYVTTRLLGYYVTTLNNSALFYDKFSTGESAPFFSFAGFWDAPGRQIIIADPALSGLGPRDWWSSVLRGYSNVEFNNVGSYLISAAELGLAGGLLYWLTLGILWGVCVRRMARGSLTALFLYLAGLIGFLEQVRIIYWVQGRFLPVLAACVVFALVIGSRESAGRDAIKVDE